VADAPREFRAETYADAAREHITVAFELHSTQRYALAHYVAGLAVECMLRAFKSRLDPVLDERHDLGRLARRGHFFDGASEKRQPFIAACLGEVVTRWDNGHRYRSESALRRFLTSRRLFVGKGDLLKNSSRRIVNAALEVVTFGAEQWKT
jgi:hypothetical protein